MRSTQPGMEAPKNATVRSGAFNFPEPLVPPAEPSVQSPSDQMEKEAVVVERALGTTGGSEETLSARHYLLEPADLCK